MAAAGVPEQEPSSQQRSWFKRKAAPMICQAVFEEISIHANGDIVCSCADPRACASAAML